MSRRHKPSKIWDYKRAQIISIPLAPACYYQEEEIFIEEIEPKLQDVTINEFITLYKQFNKNYFKHHSKVMLYSNGPNTSEMPLLFNDDFFTDFLENRYYCRVDSFSILKDYLIEEHYPNQTEYNKAVYYLENFFKDSFWEGSRLCYFKFFI